MHGHAAVACALMHTSQYSSADLRFHLADSTYVFTSGQGTYSPDQLPVAWAVAVKPRAMSF